MKPEKDQTEFLHEAVSREVQRLGGGEYAADSAIAVIKLLRKDLEAPEQPRRPLRLGAIEAEIALSAALLWVRKHLEAGELEF